MIHIVAGCIRLLVFYIDAWPANPLFYHANKNIKINKKSASNGLALQASMIAMYDM